MLIKDHKIEGTWKGLSPNVSGTLTNPTLIVIHYTASGGPDGADDVAYLLKRAAKASAHLVVGRDGTVSQIVPFNRKAWHAGKSIWRGKSNCNDYSIGIEVDNWGFLTKTQDGKFRSWKETIVPAERVASATHKNERSARYWETFTEAQITKVAELCALLKETYPTIKEIVGHDDIAPGRKSDPGPLWPMTRIQNATGARGDQKPELREVTASTLNVRGTPSTSGKIIGSLIKGQKVVVMYDAGDWAQLVNGGWVFDQYLR